MSGEQNLIEEEKVLKLLSNVSNFYAALRKKDYSLLLRAFHLILTKYQTAKEAAGNKFSFILHNINRTLPAIKNLEQREVTKKTCQNFVTRVADNTLPEVFTEEEDVSVVKQIGETIWGVLSKEEILKLFQEVPRPLTFSAELLLFCMVSRLLRENNLEMKRILLEEFQAYCCTPNPSAVLVKTMLKTLSMFPEETTLIAAVLMKTYPKRAPKELWHDLPQVLFSSLTEETITYCQNQIQLLSEMPTESSTYYNQYVEILVHGMLQLRDNGNALQAGMIRMAFQLLKIVQSLTEQSKKGGVVRTHVGLLQNHIAVNFNGASTLCPHLLTLVDSQDDTIVDAALHSLAYVIAVENITRDLILRTIAALRSTVTAESACLLIKHASEVIAKEGLVSEAVTALHKALLERSVSDSTFTDYGLSVMRTLLIQIPDELEAWKSKQVHLSFEAMNVCASFAKNKDVIATLLPNFVLLIDEQSVQSLAPIIAEIIQKLKEASPQTFYNHLNAFCTECRNVPYLGCILKSILLNYLLPNLKAEDKTIVVITSKVLATLSLQDEATPFLTEDLLNTFLSMQVIDSATYMRGLIAFAKLLEPNCNSSLAPHISKLMPEVLEYCWTAAEESNYLDEPIRDAITAYLQYAPQDVALKQAKRAIGWLEDSEMWEDYNVADDIAQIASHLAIAVPSYMGTLFPSFFNHYFDEEGIRTFSNSSIYLQGLRIMISMRIFDFFHCSKATYARKLQQRSISSEDDEPPAKKRRVTSVEEEKEDETESNVCRAMQLLLAARPSTKSIQLQSDVSWIFGMFKSRMPAELWDNKDPEVRKVMSFQPLFQSIPTQLVDISIQIKF